MLQHSEAFEYAIKLRAVADLLSSLLKAGGRSDIEAINSQLTIGWVDLTGQAFE
jgi:hypothetical protein